MLYSEDTTTTKEPMDEDDSVSLLTAEQKGEYRYGLRNTLIKERSKNRL